MSTITKNIAKVLSESPIFTTARTLYENNMQDWNYPLTKWQKLWVGFYLILSDYSKGRFPPQFDDEQSTFAAEKAYKETLQTLGKSTDQLFLSGIRKPFWHGSGCEKYLHDYIKIQNALFHQGIRPPARILEVGCGEGWTAEFLSAAGFHVLATNITPDSEEFIAHRKNGLAAKGLPHNLEFRISAMEYIREATKDLEPFDAVYVYEALHHAHDWKKTIQSFYACLKPGGWCFIFCEPNLIHTLVSYRVARLSNTHEIGISPAKLKQCLRSAGFTNINTLHNRVHFYMRTNWIAAQKADNF